MRRHHALRPRQPPAMAVMLRPDVLEASTASGRARESIRANHSCFQREFLRAGFHHQVGACDRRVEIGGTAEPLERALHLRGLRQCVAGQHGRLRPCLFQALRDTSVATAE